MNNAVVFDFDGVIIDSLEVQRKAFLESFRLVSDGPLPSFEEFLGHSGDSIPNIFKKMGLSPDMTEHYRRIAKENIHLIDIIDGMEELLRYIKNAGWLCGLCTGKDRSRTVQTLEQHGLSGYFDAVVCSDDVIHPKPHPESLLCTVDELRTTIEYSVFVGDGKNDIICAREAKMRSIAVAWGHNPVDILQQEAPSYMVYTVEELRETLQVLFLQTEVSL